MHHILDSHLINSFGYFMPEDVDNLVEFDEGKVLKRNR